ncbi:methyltransferase [Allokutzneria sp. A3M-2-11 16]|uniref:methyltransferase n=1 Tax=Allokutzneria sp. A3M-2-11 16 TaxID=2962043 RepID=UPI0020B71991|nr:methyltransferase [Allokutzneria sp. A3M-2-11 16]MCP3800450.1 methyltransferase [Allokutzneria sp. A3M-2-11 16]
MSTDQLAGADVHADRAYVVGMLFAFCPAQVVHTVTRLGVADALADGARTTSQLATDLTVHEPSLKRLMRGATQVGLVKETEKDVYVLTGAGEMLREGVPGSVRNLALTFGGEPTWNSWGRMAESVRTGRSGIELEYGREPFEWLAEHPEAEAHFNGAMAETTETQNPAVVAACDLSATTTLVDVGGGNGTLIAGLLAANPHVTGILYDLPMGLAESAPVLASVTDRCRALPGDFFESVPAGHDTYVLKSVLHDWDDSSAVRILRSCARAMRPDSELLIVEQLMPSGITDFADEPFVVMSDLNMMVCTTGKERTQEEFAALLAEAGLGIASVSRCAFPVAMSVLRATPV